MQNILSAIIFLAFGICVVVPQGVRWSHICPREIKILTCPLGTTVEVTGIFFAARKLGCPDNRTDPVDNLADCLSPQRDDVFITANINNGTDCNESNVCAVHSPNLTTIVACGNVVPANFSLVSYRCHPAGPTSPESSSRTTSTGNTDGNATSNSPVTSPAAAVKNGFPDYLIIALAAGVGGAGLIVIVLFLVIFYKTRESGDESIGNPNKHKESVGDNGKRTAIQMKEAGRPDVTIDTFAADGAYVNFNPSDPKRLYAVLDQRGRSEDLAVVSMYSQLERTKTETKATRGETNFSDITHTGQSRAEKTDSLKIYQNTSFDSQTEKADSPNMYQNTSFN